MRAVANRPIISRPLSCMCSYREYGVKLQSNDAGKKLSFAAETLLRGREIPRVQSLNKQNFFLSALICAAVYFIH